MTEGLASENALDRSNVAALIPAFREERFIAQVVQRTLAQLDCVLVVDDGSTDATAENARSAGADVIRHEVNQGKGAAIKTGLRALLSQPVRYILILDGDGQHRPEEIPLFLKEGSKPEAAAIIVGNRMSDTRTMPLVRKWTNSFMSWRISRACDQKIPDSQCGFRMIRRDLAPRLFTETNAYDYETEMLLIAAEGGFRIASVPVSTVYGDEKSKINPVRDTIGFFKLLSRYQTGRKRR